MTENQGNLFGTDPVPEAKTSGPSVVKKIKVHFENPADLKAFAEKVGQNIPVDAQGIWYPARDLK